MKEFFLAYGLFLLQAITIVVAIIVTLGFIMAQKQRLKQEDGYFEITDIGEKLDETRDNLEQELLDKATLKTLKKQRKKAKKEEPTDKERLFVIRFDGDIRANEASELRELVTALLVIAKPSDEVLLVLESGGGFVPHYGLAASQLKRVRDANLSLTVAIDKVAASGGYLMACVAHKIIAAPFAIVGSIGVLGQLPNFHRFLNKHAVDYEQHYAGQFKRTLTVFGKNTEKARKKFQQELEQTHTLFRNFIDENRPQVDLEQVATGEHWHALDAFEKKLIDQIMTSDEYIMKHHPEKAIYELNYKTKPDFKERLSSTLGSCVSKVTDSWQKWLRFNPEGRKL